MRRRFIVQEPGIGPQSLSTVNCAPSDAVAVSGPAAAASTAATRRRPNDIDGTIRIRQLLERQSAAWGPWLTSTRISRVSASEVGYGTFVDGTITGALVRPESLHDHTPVCQSLPVGRRVVYRVTT